MSTVYILLSVAALTPWLVWFWERPFVQTWRGARRARRTTRRIRARYPQARLPVLHEHSSAQHAPDERGRVMPPVVRRRGMTTGGWEAAA